MKTKYFFCGILILVLSQTSFSQNIDKMWGISAGLYENKLKEISVSYGISDRTALLFFTNLAYNTVYSEDYENENAKPSLTTTSNDLFLNFGSELRGYFTLNRVAPFGGIRCSIGGENIKSVVKNGTTDKIKSYQINAGLTLGAEYFIRNGLSVYISMSLLEYSFIYQTSKKSRSDDNIGITTSERISQNHRINLTQNPAIFLKIYF